MHESSSEEKETYVKSLHKFGLNRFAASVMWVLKQVFNIEDKYLLYEHNECEGKFLLNEILEGGNFGQYDKRYHQRSKHKGRGKLFLNKIHNNMHLLTHYTNEVLWGLIYFIWHFFWKRRLTITYKK